MDDLTKSWYELKYEVSFLKKKGNEFQNFFSEIMEKAHPSDFLRTKPWGKQGDQKNDGYLKSEKTLFQVYAPNEIEASKTVSKMEEDFTGALPHWKQYFNKWVFVHNSHDGLPPEVTKKLLELGKRENGIEVLNWGFEELKKRVLLLKPEDLSHLFGSAPNQRDLMNVGFESLQIVLEIISKQPPAQASDIKSVNKDKLKKNMLSPSVGHLLTAGMSKSERVQAFFENYHDPKFGDQIASAFNKKYRELRDAKIQPDLIFSELQVFASGERRNTPDHEAAVLAVLSYLFEKCEIFEG